MNMKRLCGMLLMVTTGFCLVRCAADPDTIDDSSQQIIGTIQVDNLNAEGTVSYELLLITGSLSAGGNSVSIRGDTTTERTWQAYDGRFKCLYRLTPGLNQVLISASRYATVTLNVRYVPKMAGPAVRVVWAMSSDGDGAFQAILPGEPHDRGTARRRLQFNALLIQTAFAEMMRAAGYGRKTIRFLRNENGDVRIHEVRLNETLEQLHRHRIVLQNGEWVDASPPFSSYDLWGKIATKIDDEWPEETSKNLVYIAFSRHDGVSGVEYAVATLGGFRTATANGISVYLFPENLDELQERLYDGRRESTYGLLSDDYFWNAWGTAIGGATHELGHSFGLAHATDFFDLMGGGFYVFHRLFAPVNGNGSPYPDDEIPFIGEVDEIGHSHAATLDRSPWFSAAAQ